MLRLLALVLTVTAGVALGLAATHLGLAGEPPFGRVRSGPWTVWPESGTLAADPYARAIHAIEGRVPLPASAGLRFLAARDDSGRRLEGRCDYAVGGATPPGQYWTLAVLDTAGQTHANPDSRSGMTSWEPTRGADGDFTIAVARQARPGNWLPLGEAGRFVLMFSVYDTPLGVGLQAGGPVPTLPTIARTTCD